MESEKDDHIVDGEAEALEGLTNTCTHERGQRRPHVPNPNRIRMIQVTNHDSHHAQMRERENRIASDPNLMKRIYQDYGSSIPWRNSTFSSPVVGVFSVPRYVIGLLLVRGSPAPAPCGRR